MVLCGGGTSSCSLVQFVPNPQLTMTAAQPAAPGFLEMQWWCDCGSTGFYQHCRGFPCGAFPFAKGVSSFVVYYPTVIIVNQGETPLSFPEPCWV